jgi:hypothetical protein
MLGMLIFSERTWKHHCVVLILPFSVLAYFLATCRPGRILRAYLIGTIAAALALMSLTSTSLMGWDGGKLAQVYGCYLWANVLLAAALVVLLSRSDKPAIDAGTEQAETRASEFLPNLRAGYRRSF